jgi:RNA polymerase sigma factor (sigma-70 family)
MPGTESVSVDRSNQPAPLSRVHESESSIREHLSRGDFEPVPSLCRQMYADTLGRYCVAVLGDKAAAAVAAGETWNLILDALRRDEKRTVRSLLLGVARRRCAYLQETTAAVPQDGGGVTLPLAIAARKLLVRLAPSEREVLVLRYVSDLTYEEIGDIFGESVAAAQHRVSRALGKLLALAKGLS